MVADKLPYHGDQELRGIPQTFIRSIYTDSLGLSLDNDPDKPHANGSLHFLQETKANDKEKDEKPWIEEKVCHKANDKGKDEKLWIEEKICHNGDHFLNSQDQILIVRCLHSCATEKDLFEGARLHAFVIKAACHEENVFVGGALVNAYAKCIALAKAQVVFDDLPVRNVVCWNGLIAGYVQHGHGERALNCYDSMQEEGFAPDEITFSSVLKACGCLFEAEKGKGIHAELLRKGSLEQDIVLGNALIDFCIKCRALEKAHQVFEELPVRDVISWTALIIGCCDQGQCAKALDYFNLMKEEELFPDLVTFACILKACGNGESLEEGRKIHAELIRLGLFETGIVLGNSLLDMYAKCGALTSADVVFQELHKRDVVSWNMLLGGYCEHGLYEQVLRKFQFMSHDVVSPDEITYIFILKACSGIGAVEEGRKVHARIKKEGYLGKENNLGNTLVNMYAKCGALAKAQQAFEELDTRDAVSWTALISGLCQCGHHEHALKNFEEFKQAGILLDVVAVAALLKACSSLGASDWGKELHAEIIKNGSLDKEILLGNALVDMYVRCRLLAKAQFVFDELPVRMLTSWNAIIIGHIQHGYEERTFHLYELMEFEGVDPDEVTLSCILKACASKGAARKGQAIHAEVARRDLLKKGNVLGNALLDMYIKCGFFSLAKQLFDELPSCNIVSWNILIAGYCQHEQNEMAIDCFDLMKCKGLSPDTVTIASALNACGSIGAAKKGSQIYADIARTSIFLKDLIVGSALVGMYAKCGELSRAREVFAKLPAQDAVVWTALIGGYCEHGLSVEALESFEIMSFAGHCPDAITFACILKACRSIGAIDKGQMHFESISRRYGIVPSVEHHTSMVDLHGRAGHFDEALLQMEKVPYMDQLPVRIALLGACKKWGNLKFGRLAFEHGTGEVCS